MDTENNPYRSPRAHLEVPQDSGPSYYVVAIPKFSVLFFATLGLYGFFWFYKNWKAYRSYTGEKIWPVPRAFFSIFFAHSLFSKIQAKLDQRDLTYEWRPQSLATWYVILSIVSNVLDRMAMKSLWSPNSDILSILILPVIYYTLLVPQKVVNFAEGYPAGVSNKGLGPANYFWIVLGAAIWLLTIFSLMVISGLVKIEG